MKKIFLASAILCLFLPVKGQNLSWIKQIGGIGIDRALSVTTDASGNIYATGQYQGRVDFDPGSDSLFRSATSSGEAFLVKLSPSGEMLKTFTYGSSTSGHTVVGNNLAIDGSGNLYTAGYFGGSNVDFDPDSAGTYKLSYVGGGNNVFVQKLDPSGNFLWAVRWPYNFESGANNMAEEGPAMALDAAGNVFTTGRFNGTRDFDPGTAGVYNLPGGNYDGYISKLNTNGEFQWAKQFRTGTASVSYIWPKSVSVDGSNNLYLAGLFKGEVDFNPDTGAAHTLTSETQVGFVVKLSATGEFLWVKSIGSNNRPLLDYHTANAVTADAAGNAYVTGSFMDTLRAGNTSLVSAGSSDIYITKLNPSGNFVWAKRIGTFYDTEEGRVIGLDANGDVYTSGFFRGSPDFNPGPGSAILSTNGGMDMFVLKLTAAGDFVWAKNLGGPSSTELIQDLAIHGDAVYSVGRFQNVVNFDPNGLMYLTPNKSDIFIHKMHQGTVGIGDLVNDLDVWVYPNPASDQFRIELPGPFSADARVSISDLQGRVIRQEQLTSTDNLIDITGLTEGVYLLDIRKDGRRAVQKLIVR